MSAPSQHISSPEPSELEEGEVLAQDDPFLQSPLRYNTTEAKKLLVDIIRASTELVDTTSCLITRLPYAVGTVQISHLINREASATTLNRLRKWWGHENFRVNSALNLIALDTHFHSGFDKSSNPLWTIIPTDEVIDDIRRFAEDAADMTTEYRKAMYDKYDVRLTGNLNTYRFVPLHMLYGDNPFYRRRSTLPADHAVWDRRIPRQDRLDRSAIESALDKMTLICYPFRDPCLQELKSHAHPFCVIVKAAPVLAMYHRLIPEELELITEDLRLIAQTWAANFPSGTPEPSVGILSESPQLSPSRSTRHGRGPRYASYSESPQQSPSYRTHGRGPRYAPY